MGDVVRALPAARALRRAHPRARLAWLVEPPSASLLSAQPWIDDVIVFPRPSLRADLRRLRLVALARALRAFAGRLRRERFDLVVDFHGILKSGLLSYASGAPLRAGFAAGHGRELAWLFANARARGIPMHVSRFERNTGLVRFLGAATGSETPPLELDPALCARFEAALGAAAAPAALHPGTSEGTPHKRYTVEGYAAVARGLFEREGLRSVVTWGPAREDRATAERVVERAGGAARLAPQTDGLIELAALLSRCRVFVGADSGPMHVASLVGTPVVQILGPTDPVQNAPHPGTPSRSVRVPVACSPCRRGCDTATCMRVVPPELVIEAALELTREGPGSRGAPGQAGAAGSGGARGGGAAAARRVGSGPFRPMLRLP